MGGADGNLSGPDFSRGVGVEEVAEGAMLLGHAEGEAVLVARSGGELFAIGATCTHYGGPLSLGLLANGTVRCPWHHACFNLRTGEAELAPAFSPVPCWRVEVDTGRLFVREKLVQLTRAKGVTDVEPSSVVIVGAGAAGFGAAEMLRRCGYAGPITMVGADTSPPYDRPNVSKDYLAGEAPEEWIPLRPDSFYAESRIDLVLGVRATALDTTAKRITLADGRTLDYGALLIATGADPIRLPIPGADHPHVHYLRTLADSRAIIARAASAKRAVVVGAGFLGLEIAASLRARGLDVRVVAPEKRPLERVLGAEVGEFLRVLHQSHGVSFDLEDTVAEIGLDSVRLVRGGAVGADLVIIAAGVRPATELAESGGLQTDRGIVVDEYLRTSAKDVWAAGDLARWLDPHSGDRIRSEHWVVAERQGQVAAQNMLGRSRPFDSVPFFWSQHYDVRISYIGHAERWDDIDIYGDLANRDCAVAFRRAGRSIAIATIGRDLFCLEAERLMANDDEHGLRELLDDG